MAGHNPDNKIKPFDDHHPSLPFTDPQALRAEQVVAARKLDFKSHGNSIYTDELAVDICALIAEGYTIKQVCKQPGMPHVCTLYMWLARYPSFADLYARASQIKLMGYADEVIDIANDGRNDWMERERRDGTVELVPNNEIVNRSTLRVNTYKWLLAKLMPKVYGEKVTLDINDKHAAVLQAARARLAARKVIEDKREQSFDAQAVTVADDSSITPADLQVIDDDSVMDEPLS